MNQVHIKILYWVSPAIYICSIFNLLTQGRSYRALTFIRTAKQAIFFEINVLIYARILICSYAKIFCFYMLYLTPQGSFRTFILLYKSLIYFLVILSSFERFWRQVIVWCEARLKVFPVGKWDLFHLSPRRFRAMLRIMHFYRWLRSLWIFPNISFWHKLCSYQAIVYISRFIFYCFTIIRRRKHISWVL